MCVKIYVSGGLLLCFGWSTAACLSLFVHVYGRVCVSLCLCLCVCVPVRNKYSSCTTHTACCAHSSNHPTCACDRRLPISSFSASGQPSAWPLPLYSGSKRRPGGGKKGGGQGTAGRTMTSSQGQDDVPKNKCKKCARACGSLRWRQAVVFKVRSKITLLWVV